MKFCIEGLKLIAIYVISHYVASIILIPIGLVGMILLFIALNLRIVKIDVIEKTVSFLLKHLAFFFVPLAVVLVLDIHYIENIIFEVLFIIILSTFLVMGFTGLTVQFFERGEKQ